MTDNELAIAVLGVVFGSIFAIVVVSKLIGLVKTWINRNKTSYDDETFDRLARAFIKHKKDSDQRFQKIEALLSDEKPAEILSSARPQNEQKSSHEIEIEKEESKAGKLPNMLNKQRNQS